MYLIAGPDAPGQIGSWASDVVLMKRLGFELELTETGKDIVEIIFKSPDIMSSEIDL